MANRSNHQKSYSKFSPISNMKHKTNTKKKKNQEKHNLKSVWNQNILKWGLSYINIFI